MPILRADSEGIARAAALLRDGAVVAYPTETSYGLAVRADDGAAVARLFAIKGRHGAQAIALIVADETMLETVVEPSAWTPEARVLVKRHWPGPLTLVLRAQEWVAAALVNDSGGVGVRISSDPIATALVRAVGIALTATSANAHGDPSASAASDALIPGVTWVVDGGRRIGRPSTVARVDRDGVKILRRGAIIP
ncbi:MAG: threonylcarbamoyl-AMP synthase [Deltaproteobacteria bacterium]|nr:threonylcarbamoyl-AMP synthase [Deltaproteobacteria bacterium]